MPPMTNNKADDPAAGVDAAAEDVALEMGADAFLSKPFTKENY